MQVSTLTSFVVNRYSAGVDIVYLICHVTLHDHLIEKVCKFMGGTPLCYVTRLIRLVTISIVMAEI